jgi:hypothetical protein
MVGMNVGVQDVTDVQAQFPDQGGVPGVLLIDRIDYHGISRFAASEQVGIRR